GIAAGLGQAPIRVVPILRDPARSIDAEEFLIGPVIDVTGGVAVGIGNTDQVVVGVVSVGGGEFQAVGIDDLLIEALEVVVHILCGARRTGACAHGRREGLAFSVVGIRGGEVELANTDILDLVQDVPIG